MSIASLSPAPGTRGPPIRASVRHADLERHHAASLGSSCTHSRVRIRPRGERLRGSPVSPGPPLPHLLRSGERAVLGPPRTACLPSAVTERPDFEVPGWTTGIAGRLCLIFEQCRTEFVPPVEIRQRSRYESRARQRSSGGVLARLSQFLLSGIFILQALFPRNRPLYRSPRFVPLGMMATVESLRTRNRPSANRRTAVG